MVRLAIDPVPHVEGHPRIDATAEVGVILRHRRHDRFRGLDTRAAHPGPSPSPRPSPEQGRP